MNDEQPEPEAILADYWRAKTGLAWSDFDVFAGKKAPAGTGSRIPEIDLIADRSTHDVSYQIATFVLRGFPLSRSEYYMALADHTILGDTPYLEFFQTRWFETAEHRGYGKPETA